MTKGPVALVLVALPVGIWTAVHRKWAALRAHSWIAGVVLFSAVVLIPFSSFRSTRRVLAETARVLGGRAAATEIVFAGRAPHSAFFYAPALIVPHTPETMQDSIDRVLDADHGSLLIIRESEWEKLPEDDLSRLRLLVEVPGWKVVESAIGDRIGHDGAVGPDDSTPDGTDPGSSTAEELIVPATPQP